MLNSLFCPSYPTTAFCLTNDLLYCYLISSNSDRFGDSRVKIAKFAPETHLLSVQRNDREVEFMDLRPFIVPETSDSGVDTSPKDTNSSSSSTLDSTVPAKSSKTNGPTVSNTESRERALRFSLSCATNPKVENKLLGFFWVSATQLVLVSKTMIELFQFNPRCLLTDTPTKRTTSSTSTSNAPMSKVREIAVSVFWWSYAAASRILMVSTDPASNKFTPFYFSTSSSSGTIDAVALPAFKTDLKMYEKVAKADLYIRQIYGLMFCIFINPVMQELVLYQIRPEGVSLYITITGLPKGPVRLSFVDNMILVHSLSLSITAVYDIRYRPKSSRAIEHPITPPLPITRPLDVGLPSNTVSQSPEHGTFEDILPSPRSSFFPTPEEKAAAANGDQFQSPTKGSYPSSAASSPPNTPVPSDSINVTPKKGTSDSLDQANDLLSTSVVALNLGPNTVPSAAILPSSLPSSPSATPAEKKEPNPERHFSYNVVQFLLPEFAVNRLNGQIYRLSLHLEGFVAAFRDQVRLCHFLMHRDNSKLILLSLVRRMIIHRADMRVVSDVLDLFTGTLQTYHEEQRLLQAALSARSSATGSGSSPHASSTARNITSASSKRSSAEGAAGSPSVRSSLGSSSATAPTSTSSISSSSPLAGSAAASSTSSGKRSSTSDPWFLRRAEQYVTAFKKSKGSNSSQSSSGAVAGSPASSGLNNTAGNLNGSSLNGSGHVGNGSPISSPSSGTTSPEVMSPNSSMGALPTPEEIGLDLSGTGSSALGGSLAFSSMASALVDPTQIRTRSRNILVVTQQDVYTQVLLPLEERGVPWKTLIGVLTTYVTSLTQRAQLAVDTDIYGFMIDLLVRNKQYYQLHQFLQLRVIADSLHVACQLMYLSSTYPPATQLGLDMFKRIKEHAYTIESLLSRGMVLIALRFLKTVRWTSHEAQSLVPRFLQEARYSGDLTLFYVTYTFFSQRNEIFTGLCDEHVRFFQSEFESPPAVLPTV